MIYFAAGLYVNTEVGTERREIGGGLGALPQLKNYQCHRDLILNWLNRATLGLKKLEMLEGP